MHSRLAGLAAAVALLVFPAAVGAERSDRKVLVVAVAGDGATGPPRNHEVFNRLVTALLPYLRRLDFHVVTEDMSRGPLGVEHGASVSQEELIRAGRALYERSTQRDRIALLLLVRVRHSFARHETRHGAYRVINAVLNVEMRDFEQGVVPAATEAKEMIRFAGLCDPECAFERIGDSAASLGGSAGRELLAQLQSEDARTTRPAPQSQAPAGQRSPGMGDTTTNECAPRGALLGVNQLHMRLSCSTSPASIVTRQQRLQIAQFIGGKLNLDTSFVSDFVLSQLFIHGETSIIKWDSNDRERYEVKLVDRES